jgi:hypothetical protein
MLFPDGSPDVPSEEGIHVPPKAFTLAAIEAGDEKMLMTHHRSLPLQR